MPGFSKSGRISTGQPLRYMSPGVKAADVHVVMLNSAAKTRKFFTHVKEHTDWRGKLYIIGFSSGRDSYLDGIMDLFR